MTQSPTVRLLTEANGSAMFAPLTAAGYALVDQTVAPADGDLTAGQAAVWFDQTNGAAKFMIKAKQADGTVVTGSVALA